MQWSVVQTNIRRDGMFGQSRYLSPTTSLSSKMKPYDLSAYKHHAMDQLNTSREDGARQLMSGDNQGANLKKGGESPMQVVLVGETFRAGVSNRQPGSTVSWRQEAGS